MTAFPPSWIANIDAFSGQLTAFFGAAALYVEDMTRSGRTQGISIGMVTDLTMTNRSLAESTS